MPAEDARIARGKRIWLRALFVILILAAMLFLPSPSDPRAVALFDALLLIIFAMGVIGLTGPAMVFVPAVAFLVTSALPVLILTWVSMDSQGSFAASLRFVVGALTEVDPMGVVWLLVPTIVSTVAAAWLSTTGFSLRFRRG